MRKRKSSSTQGRSRQPADVRALAKRAVKERRKHKNESHGEKSNMKKVIVRIFLIVNLVAIAGLLFCTYSTYLNPAKHDVLSLAGLAFPIFLFANWGFILFWLFFSTRHALLSLAGCLLCIMSIRTYIPWNPGRTGAPGKSIKLLSYNVMGMAGGKWSDDNPNPILEYLRDSKADIICLQEGGVISDRDRVKFLSMYPYYRTVSVGKMGDVLACYSKYEIVDTAKVDNQTDTNGSVTFYLKISGDTIMLINNHLQSNHLSIQDKNTYKNMLKEPKERTLKEGLKLLLEKLPQANAKRAPQADSVAQLIRERRYHGVWACGDFNDSPISYTHRVIADDMVDAFVESGQGIGISYNQKGFPFRIDNILVSKEWRTYKCTVDTSIKTSDHYPIWCYLKRIAP